MRSLRKYEICIYQEIMKKSEAGQRPIKIYKAFILSLPLRPVL